MAPEDLVNVNLIADLLQAAILETDVDLKITEYNDIFARMFGNISIIPKTDSYLFQFLDQSQWPRLRIAVNDLISGYQKEPEIYIGQKRDGSCFACEMHLKAIRDMGFLSGFHVIITDITGKVNRQEEVMIKRSEEWFRFLFRSMPGGQLLLDEKMNIDDVNDYGLLLLNFQKEELVGKNFSDICPHCHISAAEIAVGGKVDNLEQSFRHRSGREIPVICGFREFIIAGNSCLLISFHDLTQMMELQKEIVASEIKYRTLVETAQEGIAIVDPEENIVFCNDAFARIFSYNKEFLIGSNLDRLVDEDKFQEFRRKTEERGRGKRERYETIMKDRAEALHNILISAAPLYNAEGAFIGTMGLVLDITDLKYKEEALRKQRADLKWLSNRLIELQESDRKSLARELHDCIGQKLGLAKIRLGKLIVECPDDKIPFLSEISDIISDIAGDIRNISSTLRPRILDDLGLLPTIEWYLEEHVRKTGLDCRLIKKGDAYPLEPAREVNIFRIVQESILNIHKHAEATQAEISLDYQLNKITLKIIDNGKGFSVEHLPDTKSPHFNFGLLNISERVDMMNGCLEIVSRRGEGTSLIMEIPRE
jgi:PAS domain S-box-containing protein